MSRKSSYGYWNHYIHVSVDGIATEFVPIEEKYLHRIPPLLFLGTVEVAKELTVQILNG